MNEYKKNNSYAKRIYFDIILISAFTITLFIIILSTNLFADLFNKNSNLAIFMPQYSIPLAFTISFSAWIFLFRRLQENNHYYEYLKYKKTFEKNLEIEKNLNKNLENINHLTENIALCSHCKKVQDWKNNWMSTKKFLSDRYIGKVNEKKCPNCITKKDNKAFN